MKTILVLFAAVLLSVSAYANDKKTDKNVKSKAVETVENVQTVAHLDFAPEIACEGWDAPCLAWIVVNIEMFAAGAGQFRQAVDLSQRNAAAFTPLVDGCTWEWFLRELQVIGLSQFGRATKIIDQSVDIKRHNPAP